MVLVDCIFLAVLMFAFGCLFLYAAISIKSRKDKIIFAICSSILYSVWIIAILRIWY